MTHLKFSVDIHAPRATVWRKMLEQDSYRDWTTAFTEGSYYEGSWEKGARIHFLSPGGDGMLAEIADNRPQEYVSVRILGIVKGGKDDTESPEARAWAPAYENYTFVNTKAGTKVLVDVDTIDEYEKMFSGLWPKALQRLKEICERG